MLKITSDGRKLGLDQRVINPMLPDNPGSKVNLCVNNVFRFWHDGQDKKLTQLVFCDISTPKGRAAAKEDRAVRAGGKLAGGTELHALQDASPEADAPEAFSVYSDIRDKLITRGVPAGEIAFIHDADTEVKKKELFAKVRAGQVRVLMGSTAKMGAGMNVQDLLIASTIWTARGGREIWNSGPAVSSGSTTQTQKGIFSVTSPKGHSILTSGKLWKISKNLFRRS